MLINSALFISLDKLAQCAILTASSTIGVAAMYVEHVIMTGERWVSVWEWVSVETVEL